MIRVLHVGLTHVCRGTETVVMNYFRTIDKDSFSFSFLNTFGINYEYEKEIKELGGKVYNLHLSWHKKAFLNSIKLLKNFLANYGNQFDIIIHHVQHAHDLEITRIARNYHKCVVVYCHSQKTTYKKTLLSRIIEKSNINFIKKYKIPTIGCSKEASTFISPSYKYNDYVINPGIIISKYAFNLERRKEIRDFFNIDDKSAVIGVLSRISKEKNIPFAIDVFNNYHKKNSDSYMLIVGTGSELESIKAHVKELSLSQFVFFDEGKELFASNDYYNAFDFFVAPSLYEGFGITLIEAQTNGLVCFASKDAVPNSVNVTGNVTSIPLTEKPQEWANRILSFAPISNREMIKDKIINSYVDQNVVTRIFEETIDKIYKDYLNER